MNFWRGIGAALTKWMLTPPSYPDVNQGRFDDFGAWPSRQTRYDVFWAYYSNTPYDQVHLWAGTNKTLYGLYKYTRGCYNPFYRLGEFWGNTTWGGKLDVAKLGGRVVQSALPIVTDNDAIRGGINQLWNDSLWQSNKDMVPLLGSVMGDVGIKLVDDPDSGRVQMVPVHPSTIRWLLLDTLGRVQAYELWEWRWDPRYDPKTMDARSPGAGQRAVNYIEKCYREGDDVVYETFLNYEPYGWEGRPQKWTQPYGFVPFVFIPHVRKMPNYYWGWSEFQAGIPKGREVDDLASKHHDHIRVAADPKWFFAGVSKPREEPRVTGEDPSTTNPQPGRQEAMALYAGMGATATAMVFPLDTQFTSIEVQNQLAAMEKDYPELRYDSARVSGDASAKALREVRKSAEAKVHSRRAGYDAQLCEAQSMALAIGAYNGYPGYDGLRFEQYAAGELKHQIGERSVFLMDPLDRTEEEQALFTAWQTAKNAGVPDRIIMERFDWSEKEIGNFMAAKEEDQQRAVDQAAALAAAAPKPEPKPVPSGNGKVTV